MIKCIFIDFFGTLVEEDDLYISDIVQRIHSSSKTITTTSEISKYWYNSFLEISKTINSDNFITQRQMEIDSLLLVLQKFQSTENPEELVNILLAYWSKPKPFQDGIEFIRNCKIEKCIVSNIDNNEIQKALNYLGIKDINVITSEDAKCYKPNKGIFQKALDEYGFFKNEFIHVGDSYSMDIIGSYEMGIKNIWMNRKHRKTDLKKHDFMASSFNEVELFLNQEI